MRTILNYLSSLVVQKVQPNYKWMDDIPLGGKLF